MLNDPNIIVYNQLLKRYQESLMIKTESKIMDESLNPNNLLKLKISRHLNNDSLLLEISYNHTTNEQLTLGILINNKPLPFTKHFTKNLNLKIICGLNKIPQFDFEKTNHIVINVYKIKNNKMIHYLHTHTELRHFDTQKAFKINQNGLNIQIPLELDIEYFSANYSATNDSKILKDIKFANIIFKVNKFNHYMHTKKILTIAANVISNNKAQKIEFANLSLLKAKIAALPGIKDTLDCAFVASYENKKINGVDVIGYLEILNSTYYDYSSHQTVEGFNWNSDTGYIVPYNFKGILTSVIILDLNNKYKNLLISYPQNFSKSVLGLKDAYIKLNITEDITTNNRLNWMTFNNEAILSILENNYSLDELIILSKNSLLETNVD